MKKLIALFLLIFALTTQLGAFAAAQGFITYRAIAATDTTVDLNGYFRSIDIWTDTGSADVYVTFNDTVATVGGATSIKIQAGRAAGYKSPDNVNLTISRLHYIGATATGNINIVAQ